MASVGLLTPICHFCGTQYQTSRRTTPLTDCNGRQQRGDIAGANTASNGFIYVPAPDDIFWMSQALRLPNIPSILQRYSQAREQTLMDAELNQTMMRTSVYDVDVGVSRGGSILEDAWQQMVQQLRAA
jgi:hypothetical protein